jgi:hypothetical protein
MRSNVPTHTFQHRRHRPRTYQTQVRSHVRDDGDDMAEGFVMLSGAPGSSEDNVVVISSDEEDDLDVLAASSVPQRREGQGKGVVNDNVRVLRL